MYLRICQIMWRTSITLLTLVMLSHFRHISTFDFIVTFLITRHVLDVTLPVTQLLQGNSLDIMDGIYLITSLKDNMILLKDSVDAYHDAWYLLCP